MSNPVPMAHPRPEIATVPCNGCKACCRHVLIHLLPEHGDRPELYDTFECINPLTGELGRALKQAPGGACVYLGAEGCTIHDRAPMICRVFDCRRYYLNFGGRAERRRAVRAGHVDKEILRAGLARLDTLEDHHG